MQLADIDRLIAGRGYRFTFPSEIEAAYDAHRARFRQRLSNALLLPTLLCYNVFLFVDYLLLPGTFWLSAALHFFVVSPLIVFSAFALRKENDPRKRDYYVALGPIAIVAQILFIYALNHTSEAAQHCQYLAIVVLIFMNVLLRLEYDQALVTSCFGFALYVGTLFATGAPLPVLTIGVMAAGAALYLSLSANRQMQRDARHGFLRAMQDKLRVDQAQTEAELDVLTGLYNRRRLDAVFGDLEATTSHLPVAVLMVDVDHFKRFNDENGHLAGDACLKRVANALLGKVRKDQDLVVRFGGEEFLVFLVNMLPENALMIGEELRAEIEALRIFHADGKTPITVSIGVMSDRISRGAQESLIAGADAALYSAKQAGRNQIWPPCAERRSDELAEGLESDEREGVRDAIKNLQALGDKMANVAVV
ncbi:GGDEF domain-containing protein [Jiella mangrovi]|uniref:diguanylate cyclase n=1 Tax=Jiella mangrovi TaxID=2821407 RepID=A0ABS4BI27_9HYPH|nr:GGDEF domain-containing protein [Jiella mangrovi]MBP0616192.1 GGDEF domain-containing protein [Jiella mangrovi]